MNVNRLYVKKGGSVRIFAKVFKFDALLLDVSDRRTLVGGTNIHFQAGHSKSSSPSESSQS